MKPFDLTPEEIAVIEARRQAAAESTFDLDNIKPGMSKEDTASALKAINRALKEGRGY